MMLHKALIRENFLQLILHVHCINGIMTLVDLLVAKLVKVVILEPPFIEYKW